MSNQNGGEKGTFFKCIQLQRKGELGVYDFVPDAAILPCSWRTFHRNRRSGRIGRRTNSRVRRSVTGSQKRCRRFPRAVLPFVATDLNTQLGIEAGRHEPRWTPEIGIKGAKLEDETATMFRNVLKQHRLNAFNTHSDDSFTFYNSSGTGKSRIDFVCMPQELFQAVSHAGVCEGAGRRLQLVNVRRLFDHVPVQVSLSYSLDHTGFSQAAEERLNRDQLRKCITHGEKRVELLQAVVSELESS